MIEIQEIVHLLEQFWTNEATGLYKGDFQDHVKESDDCEEEKAPDFDIMHNEDWYEVSLAWKFDAFNALSDYYDL